jgi:NADH dehydrogenase FAD-containing subunit
MGRRNENSVVIYGGGIAGGTLAKKLSRDAKVTLVDPLDYFEVPMAAPRNLVRPGYAEKAIVAFATAMPRVELVRARLAELTPDGGIVEEDNGNRMLVRRSLSVLATGSSFANELMRAFHGSAAQRKAFYGHFNQRLTVAERVLIVGGGPIGVEVAGEISETWPDKSVTIVEAGARLLAGTSEQAAEYAASVLAARRVTIVTGERLEGADHPMTDIFASGGEASTSAGRRIPYDVLLWCTGGRPNTAYMKSHFAETLNSMGRIKVTPDLRVIGQERVFALGDITDLDENKMAAHINGQVKVAEANVRAILAGGATSLKSYKAQTGNPLMAVTLGSRMGVAHLPLFGVVRSPWLIRKAKAEHMLVPRYRKAIGA